MALASVYKKYALINERLARGEEWFFSLSNTGSEVTRCPGRRSRKMKYPKIGIFIGSGTSHSWLWFVDLFDRMGFHNLEFLDESAVQKGSLAAVDVLAVSGGDTFAICKALGPSGAREIKAFIEKGGLYIGSCAGAYLPMNSSKTHLHNFNFAAVKITNLSKLLPGCLQLEHKFATAYGCNYIFHPVREAVTLNPTDRLPFSPQSPFEAPLYGGPGMIPEKEGQVLAVYQGFTNKTQFLVDPKIAHDTLMGKAAAVRVSMGKGCLYLFGPHFEHPHFAAANKLIADAIYWDGCPMADTIRPAQTMKADLAKVTIKGLILDLKRELSNSRIVAAGLEMIPIRWLLGNKYYEPQKIRVFIDAMWHRIRQLEKHGPPTVFPETAETLKKYALETTALLRTMKNRFDQNKETHELAARLFDLLNHYTAAFLGIYFQTLSEPN